MLKPCWVLGVALEPPNPKKCNVLPLLHAARGTWSHISNLGVEDVEDAGIPEWIVVVGLPRIDSNIRVSPGVDRILLTSHVVRGVIDAKHLVAIEAVFVDLKTVLLLLHEWIFLLIRASQEALEKVVREE